MVQRHTIPPRSPQIEGDPAKKEKSGVPPSPESDDLERRQKEERDKTFGREQGGNQQGNQRGIGHPGDR